jgi:hypothetical protein
MRTLSVISDALAAATGIDLALCCLAVLVGAAVAALVVVLALLFLLTVLFQRREAPPLGFEEAKRKNETPH